MLDSLNSIDESDLSLADDLYYLKVNASIQKKLLEYTESTDE
jgi:hypothetical protein